MPGKELFEKVIEKFRLSGKRNYYFLVKAGQKFKDSCLKMCQRMFLEEQFPSSYKLTTLHMIYKGKGGKEQFSCNRFVDCKLWQPRLAEALLVEGGLKEPLLKNSTRFQIGGQTGHRPKELLFSMKSVLARYLAEGRSIIVQCHDVSKFFDKEVASDTLDVLYRRGVDPKVCRLWAGLNDTAIQVRTGVGMTDKADIGVVIGQPGDHRRRAGLPGQPRRRHPRAIQGEPGGGEIRVHGDGAAHLPG